MIRQKLLSFKITPEQAQDALMLMGISQDGAVRIVESWILEEN